MKRDILLCAHASIKKTIIRIVVLKRSFIVALFILLPCSFLVPIGVSRKTELWSYSYQFHPTEADIPEDVAVDSENNIIVVGFESTSSIGSKWRVMKFKPDGTILYQRTDDFSIYSDIPVAVAVDTNNNIIVAGWETEPVTREAFWRIMKYDPTLTNILWQKTNDFPPTSGTNFADSAQDVEVIKSDNSIIVVGHDQQKGNGKSQWRIIKYDESGNELWSKPYDSDPNKMDIAYAVAIQSDGKIIVVGSVIPPGSAKPDWGLKKLNPTTGDVLFEKTISLTDDYDTPYDGAVDSSDNIYVVGYEGPYGNSQWRVMKFDSNCNEIWRWATDPSLKDDRAHSIAVDPKNNIIVAGYDQENDDYKWRIMKFTPDKALIWTGFVNPLEGVSFEAPHGVAVLKKKYVVVVGSDDSPTRDYDRQWRITMFKTFNQYY